MNDPLETTLAEMTRAETGEATLWRSALQSRAPTTPGPEKRDLASMIVAALLITSILVTVIVAGSTGFTDGILEGRAGFMDYGAMRQEVAKAAAARPPLPSAQAAAPTSSSPRIIIERSVVRSAAIELRADAVDELAERAAGLVSPLSGEHVESMRLGGDGSGRRADLVLRVAAARLDAVLAELRQLGRVETESVKGEDVTAQVVDVEARLRNERRVETELLELLSSRSDAPLKDILELREALARVREQIEQLQAQSSRLSTLVALSSVNVTIRSTSAAGQSTFAARLSRDLGSAWSDSLTFLSRLAGTIARLAIGGLPFIAILALGIILWRRRASRAIQQGAL